MSLFLKNKNKKKIRTGFHPLDLLCTLGHLVDDALLGRLKVAHTRVVTNI